jgi:uncharacterized phage protein (TIGR01671 family)
MREIKFRAWDKQDNKMYEKQAVDEDGYAVDINGDEAYSNEPFRILMQYTGLKDKNGVEIYEGDIIVGQFGYKEVVKIEEFNFITREDSCAGYGFNLDSCNLDDIKKYVEVIGNIYENPELLDKD